VKTCFNKAHEIKRRSKSRRSPDIIIEKTEGLPQMMVRYDRSKIARYGLNISDLKRYDRSWILGKR
jgi:cobalt-zinc-cadmium resistance protein CzcA